MSLPYLLAQNGVDLPEAGGGGIVFWVIGAAVILGLWFLISRTRKRSYNEYWERRRREEQRRLSDPDMADNTLDDPPDSGDATEA